MIMASRFVAPKLSWILIAILIALGALCIHLGFKVHDASQIILSTFKIVERDDGEALWAVDYPMVDIRTCHRLRDAMRELDPNSKIGCTNGYGFER